MAFAGVPPSLLERPGFQALTVGVPDGGWRHEGLIMRHKATAEADPRHAADNVEPFLPGAVRTVGELLRNAREDLGLELHQVSEILRIRYAHLRAIEEGRVSE